MDFGFFAYTTFTIKCVHMRFEEERVPSRGFPFGYLAWLLGSDTLLCARQETYAVRASLWAKHYKCQDSGSEFTFLAFYPASNSCLCLCMKCTHCNSMYNVDSRRQETQEICFDPLLENSEGQAQMDQQMQANWCEYYC